MKLIDILIKENIQWPDGADGVVQDFDGVVKFYSGKAPPLWNDVWIRDSPISHISTNETASDYKTAIITKQYYEEIKMNKAVFADVKVGDWVWDIRHGWGTVDDLRGSTGYPILVDFGRGYESYTSEGCHNRNDINPTLFWDEVKFEIPPKPLPKLEVDTKVIVWNEKGKEFKLHFSHFNEDGKICVFNNGKTSFTCSGTATVWNYWKLAE